MDQFLYQLTFVHYLKQWNILDPNLIVLLVVELILVEMLNQKQHNLFLLFLMDNQQLHNVHRVLNL